MLNHVTGNHHTMRPVRRIIAFAAMLLLTIGAASSIVSAKAVYIIDDGNTRTTVESSHALPSAVVEKAGIEVSPADQIVSAAGEDGAVEITIIRSQEVSIHYMGATLHTRAYQETVSELLERMNITLNDEDEVSIDLSDYTEDGMAIDVVKYTYGTAEAVEPITYTTERVANGSMTKGKETVKQAGKNGSALVTYSITYKNGQEIRREPVSSEVITAPTTEIVEYGTKSASISSSDRITSDARSSDGSGVLTFRSGDTLTYSRVITANATAYTAKDGARTASGRVASVGCVAVDPKVIPMGSKLYITTPNGNIVYGTAVAADTGGAIKGNKVDLYYNTYNECIQFGRRNVTVYVLS